MDKNTDNIAIPDEFYAKIHSVMPIPCVDIVLIKNGKFLLAKRINKPAEGQWWFPGGRILMGETFVDAVVRKAKQETGIKVSVEKMLGADETIFRDGPFSGGTHTINVVFLASSQDPAFTVILDDQNSEYRWFSQIDENWHPYVKKFLTLAEFN